MEPDPATLAAMPVKPAPHGMVSNLVDPESRSWNVQFTMGITLLPAIVLVAARLYARLGLSRKLEIDDYITILATAATLVFNGIVLSLLDHPGGGALGPHIWNVSVRQITRYQWPAVVEAIFLRISNTLIKVSLLTFYLRIFNPVPRLKVMVWIALIAVVSFFASYLIGALILCCPRPGDDPRTPTLVIPRRCYYELPQFTTAGTIFSVVSDFYILFIPIHLLPSLKLSLKRKAAVSGVFLFGFFACFAGVTNFTIRLIRYPPSKLHDFTWDVIDIYVAKVAENNIGLMCACMPAASPVLLVPMRRIYAIVGSWFRKPDEGVQGTRGYRDLSVENPSGPAIPRATLTGMRTMIRDVSVSTDVPEMSTAMDTHSIHPTTRPQRASLRHNRGRSGAKHGPGISATVSTG